MLIEFIHEKGIENFENGQIIGTNITVKKQKRIQGTSIWDFNIKMFHTFIVF